MFRSTDWKNGQATWLSHVWQGMYVHVPRLVDAREWS